MEKNLGRADRLARVVAASLLVLCAALAPLPFAARGGALAMGLYMLATALAGTCLGYRLMGFRSCPLSERQ
jgi:hypothetical protein